MKTLRRKGAPHEQLERTPVPAKHAVAEPSDLYVTPGGARLGEMLVDANLATREQIVSALEDSQQTGAGKRLGRLLVDLGTLDERDLARIVAKQQSLELVDLRQSTPEPAATELVDETMARALTAIPMSLEGDVLVVAAADPSPDMVDTLRQATGKDIVLRVAAHSDVEWAISTCYRALSSVSSQVEAFAARDVGRREAQRIDDLVTVNDDAPVVQVVQKVLTQGLRDRASDIHIEPMEDRIRIRFRVDGVLHDVLDLPGAMGPAMVSRLKILGGMNIVERRRPQDGQISMEIDHRAVDIRVSTTAVIGGEKVVMRLLDKSRPLFHLAQLGMPADLSQTYSTLLHSPYGMVICAGPTGSGKTTTLYGSLNEINTPERNIMTIEDPVEYTFPSINQIQINEQAGITFAGGLRSILRQDPDVILVGEVRDAETARIAVQSALTGHMVLSSLHATDSVSALHRLLDMGIESFLVASAITAVLAQRLVRRNCPNCLQAYQPSPEERGFMDAMGASMPGDFMRGAGCNFCSHTGYLDRIGVYELMVVSDSIRQLIVEHSSHEEVRKFARAEGLSTLQEEAVALVQSGVTTAAEVLRSIYVAGA